LFTCWVEKLKNIILRWCLFWSCIVLDYYTATENWLCGKKSEGGHTLRRSSMLANTYFFDAKSFLFTRKLVPGYLYILQLKYGV
jgi:hypothetical protein